VGGSRQQRRAGERAAVKESRRAQFDRIHGEVLKGRTVRDLWLTYARGRLTPHGIDIEDEAVKATLERSFYAGAAAMLELTMRVSGDEVSEDVGVEMLNRLHEELDAYTKRGKADA
jgi:hypothetical protein